MGLTDEEVLLSRSKNGSNGIGIINKNSFFRLFIESLGDPIIKILLLALSIKIVFLFKSFDWFETLGIFIAVLLATLISTISEYGSESAFNRLQSDSEKILVKVLRNNSIKEIIIDDVVVNDIIILSSGDKVPADGHLIEGNLSLDESLLNGETKESKKVTISNNEILKNNLVYRGSVVYSGNAKLLVDKVGLNTIYGSITTELQEKVQDSPLKLRLKKLAKGISLMGYIGAFLVGFSQLFINIIVVNNYELSLIINTLTNFNEMLDIIIHSLTLCVTIIVVSVPEGLPMMITLVLSSNMKKMLKDNVLVRKMVGIETAGCINYLLTDKTGTLTKGKLKVNKLIFGDGKEITNYKELSKYNLISKYIFYSMYYNNEGFISEGKIIGGNSTDKALLEFIKDYKFNKKVISRIPFSSDKKYCEVLLEDDINLINGAPEIILKKCNKYMNLNGKLFDINLSLINKNLRSLTNSGNRVIVLSMKKDNDNIFIGLVSIKDDLRNEAKEAVEKIKKAGINIVMITGDSKDTAKVIAKESGIITNYKDIILTSDEFNKYTEMDIIKILPNIKVLSRALPSDKSRFVNILQKLNYVVGMTGDGVNDGPALKKADVGFSMGSGTEVAKEASDIVILDNNILSISKAILYGRTIFKSIRRFIIYQLSINVGALLISIVGSLIGVSEPITIIQMLWLNMIMDTLAALAFSFEVPLKEYMEERPKNKNEAIMNKYMLSEIMLSGFFTSIVCLLFLKLPFIQNFIRVGDNDKYLFTAYFSLFIFISIFNAFNARTERINIFATLYKNKVFIIIFGLILLIQMYIIYNGGTLFRTYGLLLNEILLVLILGFSIIPLDILRKIVIKKIGKNNTI